MNRIIRPTQEGEEFDLQRFRQMLERIETSVVDGRNVMTWILRNPSPLKDSESEKVVRSYGWNPESKEHDMDAGVGQRVTNKAAVAHFLSDHGEYRLTAEDYQFLKEFMGI